jgi:hypothetical protein
MSEEEILKRKNWHRGFCLMFFANGVAATAYGVPSMLLAFGSGINGSSMAFVMSVVGIVCFACACANAFDWGEESKALDQASKTSTEQ